MAARGENRTGEQERMARRTFGCGDAEVCDARGRFDALRVWVSRKSGRSGRDGPSETSEPVENERTKEKEGEDVSVALPMPHLCL